MHYRQAGQGPPVVLLHQSPTSSRECEPLLQQLAGEHSVFAPDMPGYGASEPLAEGSLTIEMLADNVASFMDAVGIGVAGVYGFHTGASIATAFARRHAARVSVSVATGLLCLTRQERTQLLQEYAPPFLPQWDGSHLAWLWSRLKDQSVFFPWYTRTAAGRVIMDALPPAAIHASLPDWLRSGARYRDAYQAAFRYRPECDLPYIRTPHVILDFATDPLYEHLQRLPTPHDTFDVVRCATAVDAQRIACDVLRSFPGSTIAPGFTASRLTAPRPQLQRLVQDYVTVAGTQLRVLLGGAADARPLVVIHGAQSSVVACSQLLSALLGGDRAVVGVELPGHGESDSLPDPAGYAVEALGSLTNAAVKSLGITEADLIGLEAGAAVQVELAARGEIRIGRLALVSALDTSNDAALRLGLIDAYPPPSPPDFYGGHLLRAWHEARDHRLFFPWTERRRQCAVSVDPCLDTDGIHRATVDRILSGAAGCAIRRAEINYPLSARLMTLRGRATFAAPRCDPRFDHTQRIASLGESAFLELPRDAAEWRRLLAP